ncbi:MAG: hypothetical protein QOE83_721 [Actinomycetota bacterium]|nr:hypothetical protein [Actinomycetota bacterium]
MSHRLSIRAHYERFPLSVKGAFVLRAADGDPHQVKILRALAAGMDGEGERSLDLEDVTLEVAPNLDLFVPFEVPLADLGPGWYGLRCDLAIDADPVTVHPGKSFSVPWPRATTRRANVGVAKALGGVRIDHVDCVGDAIKISYAGDAPADLRLSADGRTLPVVDSEFDEGSGKGKVTAYPVLRSDRLLKIVSKGEEPLDVALPS